MRRLALILTVAAAIVVPASPAGAAIGPLPPFTSGSSFATGFPTSCYFNGYIGPMGVAFDAASFFVVDGCTGTLYKFPLTGGDASSALSVGNGLNLGLAIVGGHYYATASSSFFGGRLQSGVYEFDPSTLAVTRMVAPLSDPRGIAADPVTGDLYVATNGSGIYRIQDPAGSPVVTSFGAGTTQGFGDGIDVTPDGSTLYVVVDDGLVRRYDLATGLVDPSFQVSLASHVPDGIAVADPNTTIGGLDVSNNVFVNSNDGTIERIDVNNGNAVSVVAQGGTRGDFVTVGADRCLYVTQSNEIDVLAPCFFQTPFVHPTSTSVACDPATYALGTQTVCTATVTDTSAVGATAPTDTVTWTSNAAAASFTPQTCTLAPTAANVASCSVAYVNASPSTDTITASYGADSTHLAGSGTASVTSVLAPVAVSTAEQVTVGDDVSIVLGLIVPDSEFVSVGDDVSIQLGPPPDSTPPVITPTVTGTLGDNGWYTSDVHVAWSVTDPESAISSSSGCDATDVTSDTTGVTFTCTATSAGGTASQGVTIERDATPPTASVSLDRGPDFGTWYNAPVGWKTTGTDATSGIASCTAPGTYSGPDSATASVSGTCTDEAGNTSAPGGASFQYDATPPTASVALARDPDNGGWYNHPVDWTVSGSDAVSGASCSAGGTYAGPDTSTASVSGTCTNGAGLSASASQTFEYDATPPTDVVTTLVRSPDSNGWYNHAVGWTTTGADATSGIADCTSGTYSGPDSGAAAVAGRCTDAAGNATDAPEVFFRFDATPPPIAITTPAAGAVYVLNQSVAAAYACGPDLSGVAACTGTVANGSPLDTTTVGTHAFSVSATDGAANSATANAGYQVQYAPAGTSCDGSPGRTALQPVAADGSSVFKAGSTVTIKFRVCDANGTSIGTPGVVTSFQLVETIAGTAVDYVNESPASTTPDASFRWDPTSQQWIFNLATRDLAAGETYVYAIGLDDGTTIGFRFGLR